MSAKDLTHLYLFCQAVRYGGFAAASLHIDASPPTLSRAVTSLEQSLCEKLVHRNAKQFQLTAAGEQCIKQFSPLFDTLSSNWQGINNQHSELSGDIHISCPEPFADFIVQSIAIDFMTAHPKVNIHIKFASDTQRFFGDQIDLAVVTKPTKTPHLIQKLLFEMPLTLAANSDYLNKFGRPQCVEDLEQHNLLAANTLGAWQIEENNENKRVELNPKYSVNSLRLATHAATKGVGICLLPKNALNSFIDKGSLVPVLEHTKCQTGRGYLVWSDRILIPARVAKFRDLIIEELKNGADFLAQLSR
ncbi:LysR family transcriptional regulator [Pseudoalteromonas sp. Z9A5]|uniref:LysR family transcriptional regulator n=1 Tax=Pseudoalteromonas sp. Z9A5 TaxID=2686355 RepID=UPI00140B598B|nr:LysR family transcriptional regulator [Pseudoalteromonas sp. Z9A5]